MAYDPIKNVLELLSDTALEAVLEALDAEVRWGGLEPVCTMQETAENILYARKSKR